MSTAVAIWWSLAGHTAEKVHEAVEAEFGYDLDFNLNELRTTYERTEASQRSVPQAIACALQSFGFEDAIRTAVSIGGDSDTIAAIAGRIAEARFGLPKGLGVKTWGYLPAEMQHVIGRAYRKIRSQRMRE